ncbi:MAG: hypothetical protein R6W94_11005, partial [Spirochaetia bacterium]
MLDLSSAEFLEGLFWSWLEDPQSVPEEWRSYFASLAEESGNGGPYPGPIPPTHPAAGGGNGHAAGALTTATAAPGEAPAEAAAPGEAMPDAAVYRQSRVDSLIWAYRDVGYIYAHLNPLENYTTPELKYMYITMEGNYESLTLQSFGLSEDDLDEEVYTGR